MNVSRREKATHISADCEFAANRRSAMAKSPDEISTSARRRPGPKSRTFPTDLSPVQTHRRHEQPSCYDSKRTPLNGSIKGLRPASRTCSMRCSPKTPPRSANFPPKACSTPIGGILKPRRRQSSDVSLYSPNGTLHALSPIRSEQQPRRSLLSFSDRYTLIRFCNKTVTNSQMNGDIVTEELCLAPSEDRLGSEVRREFRNDPKLNGRLDALVTLVRLEDEPQLAAATSSSIRLRDLKTEPNVEDQRQNAFVQDDDTRPLTAAQSANGQDLNFDATLARSCTGKAGTRLTRLQDVVSNSETLRQDQHSKNRQLQQNTRYPRQAKIRRAASRQKGDGGESGEIERPLVRSATLNTVLRYGDSSLSTRRKWNQTAASGNADLVVEIAVHLKSEPVEVADTEESRRTLLPETSFERSVVATSDIGSTMVASEHNDEAHRFVVRSSRNASWKHTLVDDNRASPLASTSSSSELVQRLTASRSRRPSALESENPEVLVVPNQPCIRLVDVFQVNSKPDRISSKTKPVAKSTPAANGRPSNKHCATETRAKKEPKQRSRLKPQLLSIPQPELKYWTKYKLKHVGVSLPRLPF